MRLLLIEESADGLLDLAIRAKALGHDVRYHVGSYDPVKHPTGKGLVERVADWRAAPNWPDLVVAGGNGKYVRDLDLLRARGVPVIGANAEAVKLELDRTAGMAAFKKAGIPTPPFRQCRTLDEAIEYVTKQDRPFACKPCGAVGDKSLSFVGKTPEDTIWRLQRWKRSGKRFPDGLMIQERIKGIEFAAGAWFGPGGFVEGIEENFETKRFMAGDLGPNTGEMGTVTRLVKSSKLFDQVLAPVESQLSRLGYVGNIDVNCIVDEDGTPYPLEWTVRLGWPAFNIELALHKSDPVEFLACVASGEKPPPRILNEIALGVVLAIPPYPFGHERPDEVVDVPLWGVTPGVENDLHFCDVMQGHAPLAKGKGAMVSDPHLAVAGSYVLVAVGRGEVVVAARNRAHRVLDRLSIPASPFWRNDIGLRLKRQVPELQRHGYAKGLAYS